MRAMCIGLVWYRSEHKRILVAVAVESARASHNTTPAIFASVLVAAFTAYALRKIPATKWVFVFLDEFVPALSEYLATCGRDADHKDTFEQELKCVPHLFDYVCCVICCVQHVD